MITSPDRLSDIVAEYVDIAVELEIDKHNDDHHGDSNFPARNDPRPGRLHELGQMMDRMTVLQPQRSIEDVLLAATQPWAHTS